MLQWDEQTGDKENSQNAMCFRVMIETFQISPKATKAYASLEHAAYEKKPGKGS